MYSNSSFSTLTHLCTIIKCQANVTIKHISLHAYITGSVTECSDQDLSSNNHHHFPVQHGSLSAGKTGRKQGTVGLRETLP